MMCKRGLGDYYVSLLIGVLVALRCLGSGAVGNAATVVAFTPIVSEVMPLPRGEEPPWIELRNPLDKSIPARLTLVINGTLEYTIPEKLPAVPPKGFVLVNIDGKGEKANRYQYEKGVAELHAPSNLRELLGAEPGYLEVYETSGKDRHLVQFVAWGGPPPTRSLTVERVRIWPAGRFISMTESFGLYDPEVKVPRGFSIGIYPADATVEHMNWVVYEADEITPGEENAVPYPKAFTSPDGVVFRSEDVVIGWAGNRFAKEYEFQLARDPKFKQLIDQQMLAQPLYRPAGVLSEGEYYYRVRTRDSYGRQSGWSRPRRLGSKPMASVGSESELGAVVEKTVVQSGDYRRQRKDTGLLCLDGCASELGTPADQPWDNVHPDDVPIHNHDHGYMNCVRASMSMVAAHFGKQISQDRIAYYDREEMPGKGDGTPDYDLAHFTGYSPNDVQPVMEWMLDETVNHPAGDPSFADLRAWLDADRPIMTATCSHMRVLSGYRFDDEGNEWVQIMDPWTGLDPTTGEGQWQTYDSWAAGNCYGVWVAPANAPNTREDEESVWNDSDGDGVKDFDEYVRFLTKRFKRDSDNDDVEDKNDIREYVFDAADTYSKRTADLDADGLRKVNDPDNDGEGFNDGCEDANKNGKRDAGEIGDNFDNTTGGLACVEKPTHCVIVFDRSGSMSIPSVDPKYDRASDAASLFLDTWLLNAPLPQTEVGLVFYDHAAYFDTDATTDTTMDNFDDSKRDKIVASFFNNAPGNGSTSIGGGLLTAMEADGFDIANLPVEDQNRMVIVLTDGKENTHPKMDAPQVRQKLIDGQVAGYVLGIGDEPQIDADKLNALADVLGNPPASFAMDLAHAQLEKFFLQVLAESRGLEFTVDPSGSIVLGEQAQVEVPISEGATRVTFVVVWEDPKTNIGLAMIEDPEGKTVSVSAVRAGRRYLVATKENPISGVWKLTIASDARTASADSSTVFNAMALEKNDVVKSHFEVRGGLYYVGDPVLIVADLAWDKKPLRDARVVVEVTKPTIQLNKFESLARQFIHPQARFPSREGGVKLTRGEQAAALLAAEGISKPTENVRITLNDNGLYGDLIPGDGRYSAYFRDTRIPGVHTFHIVARSKMAKQRQLVHREELISVLISPEPVKRNR